jgi:hypothetical protein
MQIKALLSMIGEHNKLLDEIALLMAKLTAFDPSQDVADPRVDSDSSKWGTVPPEGIGSKRDDMKARILKLQAQADALNTDSIK